MAPLKNEDRSKNGCNQRNRSVRKIMRKVNRFRIDLVPLIYSAFRFSVATASSVEQCVDQLRDAPSIVKETLKKTSKSGEIRLSQEPVAAWRGN